MEALLIYLGKVALSIAAFYILYILLYRTRKQFRFNRLYLSGSLFLSFIIPLVTITITRPAVRQMVILPEPATEIVSAVSGGQPGTDIPTLLLFIYLGVVILFSLRLFTGQFRAFSIIRKCRVAVIKGATVYITGKDVYPFTFFNKIVISECSLSHPDLEMILDHEKVHADEKHTLDILLSELLFLFQWFNPLAWMHKEALKNNLEFLADQIVVQRSDMQAYQMAMVSMAKKEGIARFLNALNGNDLKNRIIMMKKKTENRNKVIRQITVLPLLVFLFLGLSHKEFRAAPDAGNIRGLTGINQVNDNFNPGDSLKEVKKEIVVIGYPGNTASGDTIRTRIKSNGMHIRTITHANQQNATDGDTGKSDSNVIHVIGYNMKMDGENFSGDSIIVRTAGNKQSTEPLYIMDEKEIKSLDGVSPEKIESITVLKDESSTAVYGEKGRNGVIIITSKKSDHPADDILIMLDGIETTKKVSDINPDEIQSVNVLKGESATAKYGEKGKKGAIEITMKHVPDKNNSIIRSTQELRKHIASTIHYPSEAIETRKQGSVNIYAFVTDNGKITQITESRPKADFVTLDEVVIVGYGSNNETEKIRKSATILNEEAALRVKNLPDLDIPEFKNKWVAFQFKFVLH